jgi:NitT/TauT family transport system ATP-binding protein
MCAPIVAAGVGKSFSRSSQLAFTNINLEIRTGEFLCLVGPSGCGKSTFLFMVAGLVPLSIGRLEIDGVTIYGPSWDRGLVFQERALFPRLSVRDNIAFGFNLHSWARGSRELQALSHHLCGWHF